MRIILTRPYQTKPKGAVLNTVPTMRAKRMIENGIAIAYEEKKPKVNKANDREA